MDFHQNEEILVLLLSDSNLPTGGFISSSGLESYVQHAMSASITAYGNSLENRTITFWQQAVQSYANQSLAFFENAYHAIDEITQISDELFKTGEAKVLERIIELDKRYDIILMNDVTRRTRAQGLAHLVLFEKCFLMPGMDARKVTVLKAVKKEARRGKCFAHQPIAFGLLAAALGISLERARYLYLFLYSRAILSAAVRLNLIGPYASQRILVQHGNTVIQNALLSTVFLPTLSTDDNDMKGSATTNPLMEILNARHDLIHSRMFNS